MRERGVRPDNIAAAGQGDADAYCSSIDCKTDMDCPGGYFCGVTRDPHPICDATYPGTKTMKGGYPVCTSDMTPEPCIALE